MKRKEMEPAVEAGLRKDALRNAARLEAANGTVPGTANLGSPVPPNGLSVIVPQGASSPMSDQGAGVGKFLVFAAGGGTPLSTVKIELDDDDLHGHTQPTSRPFTLPRRLVGCSPTSDMTSDHTTGVIHIIPVDRDKVLTRKGDRLLAYVLLCLAIAFELPMGLQMIKPGRVLAILVVSNAFMMAKSKRPLLLTLYVVIGLDLLGTVLSCAGYLYQFFSLWGLVPGTLVWPIPFGPILARMLNLAIDLNRLGFDTIRTAILAVCVVMATFVRVPFEVRPIVEQTSMTVLVLLATHIIFLTLEAGTVIAWEVWMWLLLPLACCVCLIMFVSPCIYFSLFVMYFILIVTVLLILAKCLTFATSMLLILVEVCFMVVLLTLDKVADAHTMASDAWADHSPLPLDEEESFQENLPPSENVTPRNWA